MDPEVFQAASSGDSNYFENSPESRSDIPHQETIGKNTVLHVALQFEQFKAATSIVKLFPDLVYKQNSRGNTPLHIAARIGNLSMVEHLLDQDKIQDIETGGRHTLWSMVNLDRDTALHVAVRHGKFEVVKALIKVSSGQLANQINNAGESALFLAVDRQSYDMASLILDHAPDCSYYGRHGMNVLHALVIHTSTYSSKDKSVFQRLRDIEEYKKQYKKARSRSRRLLVITFVWVVNMLFLIPLPNLLEDPSEKKDKKRDEDDFRLRTSGTIPTDFVENVMHKWPSTIIQPDESGWTPLHIAAHLGNADFVRLLLRKGNSPAYVLNKEGLSAFHIAAKEGNYNVMDRLMQECPDIYELLDNSGRNALHTAAESGDWTALYIFGKRERVFKDLVNEQDKDGNTPSHLAAINGNTSMAERLGKGGEIVNEQDKDGNTPSHLAAINGDTSMAERLREGREIVLNATNKWGFTTLDNVLLRSKLQSSEVKQLWDMGARLSLRGVLLKVGIQNLDPRKETELAGDGDGDGNRNGKSSCISSGDGKGDGDGNDEGMSNSDFLKQVREGNMLVATLIATVTFTAAFTVPGGFNQNGNVGEGMAVLSEITAFRVFLIANTLAFGLSVTSVFVHFLAFTTSEEIAFHRKIERRTAFYTNWSIGAMLVAFIAGTYAVVPHSWGITVAALLSCCFLSSLYLPVTIKDYGKYI